MPETEYDNEMRGALFTNEKRKSDKSPGYNGQCQIDGKEYWISGWKRKSRAGKVYLSLAFNVKEAQMELTPPPGSDEDIPF